MPEREMAELKRIAKRESSTVGEWVRRELRRARELRAETPAVSQLRGVRETVEPNFPGAEVTRLSQRIQEGLDMGVRLGSGSKPRVVQHGEQLEQQQATAAMHRIQERAKSLRITFDWEVLKADRDAGRS